MRPLYLFLAFLLIEISAFAAVGGEIGVLGTLAIVIGSTALGVAMLKRQGFEAAQALRMGVMPADPAGQVAQRSLGAIAAFLLIVPGLVTTAFGLVLMIPAVRAFLWRKVEGKIAFVSPSGFGTSTARGFGFDGQGFNAQGFHSMRPDEDGVVDGEYEDVTGAESTARRLSRPGENSGGAKGH